jgi:cell fate (sporulation/competence/biofilm development) regulator YlbF (YheA/YmcA/DUF963 family)
MSENNIITEKTRELCEAIAAQPDFRANIGHIETFMDDEKARSLYETVATKGQALHEKQHSGQPLDGAEIAAFEKDREALLANPVAKAFLEAQDEIHELQHSIEKQIKKTLQLGRVPTTEDLNEGGSCGHGCGCH